MLPGPRMRGGRDLPATAHPKRQSPILSEVERALEMSFTFIQDVFREHLFAKLYANFWLWCLRE